MKALSVRPHWAYAIIHLGKDVENRTWATPYRGPLVIHAGARLTAAELDALQERARRRRLPIPERADILEGGVIGVVELADIVERSRSSWFKGPVGWVVHDPRPIEFVPFKGQLKIFDVPNRLLR